MEKALALRIMSALSQPTRFEVFRRLAEAFPEGMAAGNLAVGAGATPSTMSAHLAVLSRAELVTMEKVGRTVLYTARPEAIATLQRFLAETVPAL